VESVGVERPVPVGDSTRPLTGGDSYGGLATTSNSVLVPGDTVAFTRKVVIRHGGDAARVYLGIGKPAIVGQGEFLDPGDVFVEFVLDAVHIIVAAGSASQLVTAQAYVP
jgi:pyruvate/2-oxoglutarate dehydrogenase complex dihydrolipoamide dehydrogenase (E3) component